MESEERAMKKNTSSASRSLAALVVALAALTACQSTQGQAPSGGTAAPSLPDGQCDTEPAQYIGQPLSAASIIPSENYRVIRPNMPVTLDLRPNRTSIEVDDDGIITSVRCG
jgi:hypothetical protein